MVREREVATLRVWKTVLGDAPITDECDVTGFTAVADVILVAREREAAALCVVITVSV